MVNTMDKNRIRSEFNKYIERNHELGRNVLIKKSRADKCCDFADVLNRFLILNGLCIKEEEKSKYNEIHNYLKINLYQNPKSKINVGEIMINDKGLEVSFIVPDKKAISVIEESLKKREMDDNEIYV